MILERASEGKNHCYFPMNECYYIHYLLFTKISTEASIYLWFLMDHLVSAYYVVKLNNLFIIMNAR